MIHLPSEPLDPSAITQLAEEQASIDSLSDFKDRAIAASNKWNSKPRAIFHKVKETLLDMCVGVEICVYCEQNEATDIEHIYPKKLYPEKTFQWDNYVLACGNCNSRYKIDNFSIFDPAGSNVEKDVKSPRGQYLQPSNDDALFINQRIIDPMDLMELDLKEGQFIFVEKHAEGSREYMQAKHTTSLLGLNSRAALVASRKNAARFYLSTLTKYVTAKTSSTFHELRDAINDDWGGIDDSKPFADEKARVLNALNSEIREYAHPTVWKEMLRQRNHLPNTNRLLSLAPEALNW